MYNVLIIGHTGQGKSPMVKKLIEGRNCYVFDVHNEYGERVKPGHEKFSKPLNLPNNPNAPRAREISGSVKTFVANCLRRRNTVCVFEDATIFFKGQVSEDVRRLMVNKLFSYNVNVFVFHSIRTVPPDIMSYTDYCILFKTGDEPEQANKYPSLYPYYMKLRNAPKGSKMIIDRLNERI